MSSGTFTTEGPFLLASSQLSAFFSLPAFPVIRASCPLSMSIWVVIVALIFSNIEAAPKVSSGGPIIRSGLQQAFAMCHIALTGNVFSEVTAEEWDFLANPDIAKELAIPGNEKCWDLSEERFTSLWNDSADLDETSRASRGEFDLVGRNYAAATEKHEHERSCPGSFSFQFRRTGRR